jgi:hypothetical protein
MLSEKGLRMSVTYRSEFLVFSKNMGPIREAAVKGHFKRLLRINTAPVPIVLSIDIPTQMEPSFINEKCKFWVKEAVMYCLQKPVTKIHSSPVIAFFNYFNLCYFIRP